ncbi:MAG: DEAD/DEAH box helicase [Gemmatimonadaceae bacterium]|nr:DEAD/DEAH box helicase [Gemmatimonadaceae bacterium]
MPSPALTRYFSPQSRERGDAIVRSRSVRLLAVEPTVVFAEVTGTEIYHVEVSVKGKTATLSCSCPYAADYNACKHVWATLQMLVATHGGMPLALALSRATGAKIEPADSMDHEEIDDEWAAFDEEHDDEMDGMDDSRLGSARDSRDAPHPLPLWHSILERAVWQQQTALNTQSLYAQQRAVRTEWPSDRRIVYVIDGVGQPHAGEHVVVEVMTERQAKDGSWSAPKKFSYTTDVWLTAPDARDRAVTRLLLGVSPIPGYGNARATFVVGPHALEQVLPAMHATGQLRLRLPGKPPSYLPVEWEPSRSAADLPTEATWTFVLQVETFGEGYAMRAMLARGTEQRLLNDALWIHPSGLCVFDRELLPVSWEQQWPLARELWRVAMLPVGADPTPVLERLFAMPEVPTLRLPPALQFEDTRPVPIPGVRFTADPQPWRHSYGAPQMGVQLAFRYGPVEVRAEESGLTRFDVAGRQLIHRDIEAERRALSALLDLGPNAPRYGGAGSGATLLMPRSALRRTAQALAQAGWWVEADGRGFRTPGAVRARVRSSVDWFDLDGHVNYGDLEMPLSEVLEAQRRGDDVVTLPDGSLGMLPQDWLHALGPVMGSGERTATGTRFRRSQLALLDALLATIPEVDVDAQYAQQREALRAFERVTPAPPPTSFAGTLRPYQQDGLGWMHFLRDFGFGGCLADDMGLGKTIQVLALLESRRTEGHGPSLVVVPRSLVFNWRAEAERFAPALRVVDWSSATRHDSAFDVREVDVALVTYGTLRRDAVHLAEIDFDYVVLDEAQAIKNHGTATAKACRVLKASHRLAMTGTPVENRLEELWSLLDFLNPGLLGPSSRFAASLRNMLPDTDANAVLAQALRPVILRRTKAQVAPELPARIERTLEVEMEPKQRAFYDQLRTKVRADVLASVDAQGLAKSKLHILEGLLRLRQAACHPVLVDARKRSLPSAKLDALLPALAECAAEGHKALVFSQFTSLLALVRAALDTTRISYEYLDGRTKDRQARVDRFQRDAACPVFLISLKAGGHGLNLTAADYVYLLDPWWNPAVEAQAIDRAHRIGRRRKVVATRLVARDSIEEKILQLQQNKRALADAVLSADRGGLSAIGREELELLLS